MAYHPYCIECGVVSIVGSDCGRPLGHYINLLYTLSNYISETSPSALGLTRAQRGLIVRELEASPTISDCFGVSLTSQKDTFIDIVRAVRPDITRSLLEQFMITFQA